MTRRVAAAVFSTLTGPLPSREQLRAAVGPADWEAMFERPLGRTLSERLGDDLLDGGRADRRADRHLRRG